MEEKKSWHFIKTVQLENKDYIALMYFGLEDNAKNYRQAEVSGHSQHLKSSFRDGGAGTLVRMNKETLLKKLDEFNTTDDSIPFSRAYQVIVAKENGQAIPKVPGAILPSKRENRGGAVHP